jgi:hypothetical protein
MGEDRKVCRILVGKPAGKIPLERPRSRCEDGISNDVWEIGWGGGRLWSGFAWLRTGTVGWISRMR